MKVTKNKVKEEAAAPTETFVEEPGDFVNEVLDEGYIDVMNDKTVVIYSVGGTIAMKSDEKGALIPASSGEDLIAAVPELKDLCNIEVVDFANVPSGAVTPEMMLRLSRQIQKTLQRPEVAGVVVTHGTDTLEETAYFLAISQDQNFAINNLKPIVVTGAMRGGDAVGADGPANLLASVRTACRDYTNDAPPVMVCFNDELHDALRVVKTHSGSTATFKSPFWGPVGYVDEDRIYFRNSGSLDDELNFNTPKKLTAKVNLVKAVTGDHGEFIDFSIQQGVQGIIIEGFGRGNIPYTMIPAVKRAVKAGIVVVIATRTLGGRVLDCYGYKGSVTDALNAGAIMAGETTAAKARLLLMYLLSQDRVTSLKAEDPERFRVYMQETFDPVLADRLFR